MLARIALGPAGVVPSSGEPAPDVAERFLSGELPVRIEDLPYLARALGVSEDSRVRVLEAPRLRTRGGGVARGAGLRRVLTPGPADDPGAARGTCAFDTTVEPRGPVAASGGRRACPLGAPGGGGRTVSVPDVVGLELIVFGERNDELRVRALRWALWAAVATSLFGLVAVRRAFAREARATTREKAFVAG